MGSHFDFVCWGVLILNTITSRYNLRKHPKLLGLERPLSWSLDNIITAVGILLATSGVIVTSTGTPVTYPYPDFSSPIPYFLHFVSFTLAMIAMLTFWLQHVTLDPYRHCFISICCIQRGAFCKEGFQYGSANKVPITVLVVMSHCPCRHV